MTLISVGKDTHQGMQRTENQDYADYCTLENIPFARDGILLVLADGMGGHAGGSVASKIAVTTIIDEFRPKKQSDIINALRHSFIKANDFIISKSLRAPQLKGMGTTLTAIVIYNDQLYFAHVGDSRGYLLTHKEIAQITEDHTYVADLLKQGLITPNEAQHHPYDNIITRAIGVANDPMVDHSRSALKVKAKQSVLLCSDGLYKCVDDQEIFEIVSATSNPSEACQALIHLANQRGGPDNITVLIARIEKVSAKRKWLERLRQR